MLLSVQSRTASIAYFSLITSNLFYSPTLTWSSNFSKFGYSKPYIVFGAFFVSAILACITEFLLAPSRRPKSRSISSPFNVISLAILRTLTVTGIILGLSHTSPFRVITLTLGSQLWIHKIQHPKSLFSKTVMLFLLGWLLSFFSDIQSLNANSEIESTESNLPTFKNILFSYTWLMISCISQYSRKFFEIKLVASSVAPLGFKAKELNIHFQMIFSLAVASILIVPWLWVDQSLHSGTPVTSPHSLLYQFLCFSSFASTVILSDYYIELLAQTELHTFKHIPYVWATSVFGSIIHILSIEESNKIAGFPNTLTFLEWGALASIILGFFSAYSSSQNVPKKSLSSLDLAIITRESSWGDTLSYFIKSILASQDSKQIFYFLCLNLSYMFVQLAYGFWTNSLGLISDAIHMFFDCVALGVGLFASVTSKWEKNREFSYGYSRVEVLSGFSNGVFLALISIFIVLEAIARLLHPPEMNTDRLLLVSFMGLVVNLIGILAFNHGHHHGHSHGGHDHGDSHSHDDHTSIQMNGVSHNHSHDHSHDHAHDHSHDHDHDHDHSNGHSHSHSHEHSHGGGGCGGHSHNMEGVFLHILADTLGSVGVIISTLLIQWFGWTGFDPIASMFIAGLIFFSVLPLIKSSFSILLLYVPPHINQQLNYSLKEISNEFGSNCEILDAKIWPNDHGSYILTLNLKFYEAFNSTQVQSKVTKIVNRSLSSVTDITIQTSL